MPDPFFAYFDSDRVNIDPASLEWQPGVSKYKSYPRAPKIILPEPEDLPGKLATALLKRKSARNFSGEAVSLQTLSSLLFWSAGLVHKNESEGAFRRSYPSGGTLFPIEIYPVIFTDGDVPAGVYHYDTEHHALEHLESSQSEAVRAALFYEFSKMASLLIVMTFSSTRVWGKYGSLGYKLGLLEAGHIAQNFYLVATALGLGVLALGDTNHGVLEGEFGFVSGDESILYLLAVGSTN